MPETILKQYFGYDQFREGQKSLIEKILKGNDVLGIMPTGAGKSICFQVPAIIMDGITLVVSPLISLMQDQVKGLIQYGISAAYINSSLSQTQIEKALINAKNGKYKIIYVAPERLLTPSFLDFAQNSNISMLTVDEAHCISQWGQDFRPSYALIPEFISKLAKRPVVSAFTATATEIVKEDIVEILQLENPYTLVSGFDRENLYFEVQNTRNKMDSLLAFLKNKKSDSGVIYCSTRKAVDSVYEELLDRDYSVKKYHAGLTMEERRQSQTDFVYDKIKIIVATNAFGMGIDKSNVNFVVHYNMPKDMESYYQEAGRAGRDGTPAHCIMLYSPQDVVTNQFLIENGRDANYENEETEKLLKERDYKRLREINFYSTTNECLRQYILNYFGEKSTTFCGSCSNCDTKFEIYDATIEAQKIISCVIRVNQRFGKMMIIDILKGSKNKKLLEFGFDKLPTYGISEVSPQRLRTIMDNLIATGYLEQSNSQYAMILTTAKSQEILKNEVKFEIKIATERERKERIRDTGIPRGREDLFEGLRALRAEISSEQGVPAFVVFADASLVDMCVKLPATDEQFLKVSGVGRTKLEKYGKRFMDSISNYCKSASISQTFSEQVFKKQKVNTGELVLPNNDMICQIEISDEAVPVSEINSRINAMLEFYKCTKVTAPKINNWLEQEGFLITTKTERGNSKVPTDFGFEKGITQQEKIGTDYKYMLNLYPKSMQEYIINSLTDIMKIQKSI